MGSSLQSLKLGKHLVEKNVTQFSKTMRVQAQNLLEFTSTRTELAVQNTSCKQDNISNTVCLLHQKIVKRKEKKHQVNNAKLAEDTP